MKLAGYSVGDPDSGERAPKGEGWHPEVSGSRCWMRCSGCVAKRVGMDGLS
jgi:hypothetical protein